MATSFRREHRFPRYDDPGNFTFHFLSKIKQEMLPLLEKSLSDGKETTIVNISGLKGSIESFVGNFEAIHGNLAYMCSKVGTERFKEILRFRQLSTC